MIYFITNGTHVKIGVTKNEGTLKNRVATLQTGCPEKIRILMLVNGDSIEEKRLHYIFKKYNTHGEWFRFETDVLTREEMVSLIEKHSANIKELEDAEIKQAIEEINKREIAVFKKSRLLISPEEKKLLRKGPRWQKRQRTLMLNTTVTKGWICYLNL